MVKPAGPPAGLGVKALAPAGSSAMVSVPSRSREAAGLQRDDAAVQRADGVKAARQFPQRRHGVVMRGLALVGVGGAERVDLTRQRAGRAHDLALLGLAGRIAEQGREPVTQRAEAACQVFPIAGRAVDGVDRLQRGGGDVQGGDGAILGEQRRLQGGVQLADGGAGDDAQPLPVGGEIVLGADLARIVGCVGIDDVLGHEAQLAVDIAETAHGDPHGAVEVHGLRV